MKLSMPIKLDGETITEVTLREPTAEDVANARREFEHGDEYQGIAAWSAGCIRALNGREVAAKDALRVMRAAPYRTALDVALFGRLEMDADDGIEGTVVCPSCRKSYRNELREVAGEMVDTRDHLNALDYVVVEDPEPLIFDLKSPIQITMKSKGEETIEEVVSVTLHYPTIGDCSRALASSRGQDSRTQIAVYAEALESVNGQPVSSAYKATMGRLIFGKMSVSDSAKISNAINAYGLDSRVKRYCPDCGHEWTEEVNIQGFFASALGS